MQKICCIWVSVVCLLAAGPVVSQQAPYPPEFPNAEEAIYKTASGVDLKLWIFEPQNGAQSQRPAIVFFFGGGFVTGSPSAFENEARHLASRGMVAVLADYRVATRHATQPDSAVQDARAAIAWVRENARRLSVDPQRIAAAGGSSGGHLAVATAIIDEYPDPFANSSVEHAPNALVLFQPLLILAPVEGHPEIVLDLPPGAEPLLAGLDRQALSPYHQMRQDVPPTIIFNGTADELTPYPYADLFCEKSRSVGNECALVGYEGQGHGFDNLSLEDALQRTDAFFVALGWLSAED
jgi:acetyl esterase/lipase